MRTMEESIEQKAQERADRKLQYNNKQIRGCERRTPQTILQRAADPGGKGSEWEILALLFMELCKENAPVTPTKASEA